MASITITVPDAVATRVLDAFCAQNGYQSTIWAENAIDRIPNPETKIAFTKRLLLDRIMNDVINHETALAVKTTQEEVQAKVNKEIQLK